MRNHRNYNVMKKSLATKVFLLLFIFFFVFKQKFSSLVSNREKNILTMWETWRKKIFVICNRIKRWKWIEEDTQKSCNLFHFVIDSSWLFFVVKHFWLSVCKKKGYVVKELYVGIGNVFLWYCTNKNNNYVGGTIQFS